MSKKYLPTASPATTFRFGSMQVITNDLFMAAFLVSVGCTLDRIEKNERRRVSFVFTGERVNELREAYRTGPVHLDMRLFRENLNRLRDRLAETIPGHTSTKLSNQHPDERSMSHVHHARNINNQSRFAPVAHA
jgi:hypothetical protein